jgi:CDP-diacylglycerol pyrophosphatase
MKTDTQSNSLVTSAWYARLAYSNRFAGNAIVDNNVEIAVNVTLNARSALKIEQNLEEKKVEK